MDFGGDFDESDTSRAGLLDRVQLPFGDALGAVAHDAWVHNPVSEGWDAAKLFNAGADRQPYYGPGGVVQAPPAALVDPAALNKQYGPIGLHFDSPVPQAAVDLMVARKQDELNTNAMIARAPDTFGFKASSFLTSLAVSALDPINVASAFVPVVGEARYGLWAERFGATAARVGKGAIEGAAGAALTEPLRLANEHAYQGEYGAMDSFMNVAMGGLLGGGLHAGFGKISDLLGRAHPETREGALRSSVAQMAEGRPVDVAPVLASDPAFHPASAPVERTGPSADDIAAALRDVQEARAPFKTDGETDLISQIRAMGGIRTHDAAGKLSREGSEVKAILGDAANHGLLRKGSGLHVDHVIERLHEEQWFGHGRSLGDVHPQELYDLLDAGARGKVYHPESEIPQRHAYRDLLDRELSEAGIASSDKPDVAARKLAEFRAGQSAHEFASAYEHEADSLYEHLSPDTQEALQSHGYEPGSDIGAEFETGGALEGAGRSENAAAGPQGGAGNATPPSSRRAVSPDFSASLDRAREVTAAQLRGETPSTAVSPDAAASAERIVKEGSGDDIEAELQEATDKIREYEKQGALSPEEAAAFKAVADEITQASKFGQAAEAASRCLLLHP